jgi:3-dehydroquinate dehydratase type I
MTLKHSLCGCLVDVSAEQIAGFLNHPGVELLEWRLDDFLRHHSLEETIRAMELLSVSPRCPVLVTNRPVGEGGMFEGPEALRIDILQRAVDAGAEWIDLEWTASGGALERLQSRDVRILISHHDFSGTPDRESLRSMAREMAARGAKAIKIVSYAHEPEDNLRVLDLIPFGRRELGIDVIAFCMGPLGRWSRFACLLLGSPWTYVQLPGTSPVAPGQFSLDEMRALLKLGGWMEGS